MNIVYGLLTAVLLLGLGMLHGGIFVWGAVGLFLFYITYIFTNE